jgi:hypothetical protein
MRIREVLRTGKGEGMETYVVLCVDTYICPMGWNLTALFQIPEVPDIPRER